MSRRGDPVDGGIQKAWKLIVDDQRDPENVHRELYRDPIYLEPGWEWARTVDEAIALIDRLGYPELISFDHDLGKDPVTGEELPSGKDLANILVERDMDRGDMPAGFRYRVHSQNCVGAENLRGLLDQYLASRTPGVTVPRPW